MIPVYPMDCGKEPCDNPLEITAEMSKLVMYVLNYAFDDVETVQKAIDDANKTVVTAAVKYVNFLLTKITNNVTSVTDYLGSYLENLLTEQQVMLNTVAPGLFAASMAELDKPQQEVPPTKEPAVVATKPQVNGEVKDVSPTQLAVLPMLDMPGVQNNDGKEPGKYGVGLPQIFTSNQPETQFEPGSTAETVLPIDVSLALNPVAPGNGSAASAIGGLLGQQNQRLPEVVRICLVECPTINEFVADETEVEIPNQELDFPIPDYETWEEVWD